MTTTTRPMRRLALLAATIAIGASTALAPAAPSSAAPARPTGRDLPRLAQVDDTFPYLEGGARRLLRSNRLEILSADCLSQRAGVEARARFASYQDSTGDSPFFSGREDPTFVVYQFSGRAKAAAAYRQVVKQAQRCRGTRVVDGVRRTTSRVAVPRLGQRQLGFREVTVESGDRREDLEVYVLHGKRIERSWIQLDTGRIKRGHAVAMARLLSRTAR